VPETAELLNISEATVLRDWRAAKAVVDWVRPQGGMTAFVQLVPGANGRAFCQAALKRGLLLAPGDCWNVPDHLRIGFGVGHEWYPRAMERFSELLGAWCREAQPSIS
jgi:DNA-binding transcriptional MocR family regulator